MISLPKTVGEIEFFLENTQAWSYNGVHRKPPQKPIEDPTLRSLINAPAKIKAFVLEQVLKQYQNTVKHLEKHMDENKQVTTCFNPECWKQQTSLKKCTQCNVALYCSEDCKIKHWPVHKVVCQLPAAPAK